MDAQLNAEARSYFWDPEKPMKEVQVNLGLSICTHWKIDALHFADAPFLVAKLGLKNTLLATNNGLEFSATITKQDTPPPSSQVPCT